jgi:hypothetical protein
MFKNFLEIIIIIQLNKKVQKLMSIICVYKALLSTNKVTIMIIIKPIVLDILKK